MIQTATPYIEAVLKFVSKMYPITVEVSSYDILPWKRNTKVKVKYKRMHENKMDSNTFHGWEGGRGRNSWIKLKVVCFMVPIYQKHGLSSLSNNVQLDSLQYTSVYWWNFM